MTEAAAHLASQWRAALDEWRIPPEILAAAPESPWLLPTGLFAGRARRQLDAPSGFSTEIAVEGLRPDNRHERHQRGSDSRVPGTVLDVGVGAGAASLGLRGHITEIIGVDESERMLDTFTDIAADAGVAVRAVRGRWPDVASTTPVADVVVCHHVLYNVPDLLPFLESLTAHARSRVVVEITRDHPTALLNPLWKAIHGIDRPVRPTAVDAIALVDAMLDGRGLGHAVGEDTSRRRHTVGDGASRRGWRAWERPITTDGTSWDELVASTAKRLCVGPDRAAEVEAALRDLGAGPDMPHIGGSLRQVVTIWWPGTGDLSSGTPDLSAGAADLS